MNALSGKLTRIARNNDAQGFVSLMTSQVVFSTRSHQRGSDIEQVRKVALSSSKFLPAQDSYYWVEQTHTFSKPRDLKALLNYSSHFLSYVRDSIDAHPNSPYSTQNISSIMPEPTGLFIMGKTASGFYWVIFLTRSNKISQLALVAT